MTTKKIWPEKDDQERAMRMAGENLEREPVGDGGIAILLMFALFILLMMLVVLVR